MLTPTDLIAVTIALAGSIFTLVIATRAYAVAVRENRDLRRRLADATRD